jgi:type 1 fimbriae regulatory protein FimB/type 1 fimbriae regulatory protein FimE
MATSAKRMGKRHLRLVTPATVIRTVAPKRPPNRDLRTREFFTEAEVERLMKAATRNRWGHRDATMILVAYRHGLRASELVDLRWDQVDFRTATLHVRRLKQGTPSTHPILGDELRALRRLQRKQGPKSAFVFTSERDAPFSSAGFARMIERAGAGAKFSFIRPTHTCSGMPADTSWPMTATTPDRCKPISGTGTSSIRFATLS